MLSIEREPVVAGTFYSSDPDELIHQLKECFVEQQLRVSHRVSALVVPHAGYVYSGTVAASAYALIDQDAKYDNIFLIGSSHHLTFNGASVYNKGHYKTPLGVVPVNIQLANQLIEQSKNIVFNPYAHSEEHTLEVQLPFLQYRMRNLTQIVPIVIGVKKYSDCQYIASVLKPYFNHKNLFVFSTDLSHYPNDEVATRLDKQTVDLICKNNPDELIEMLNDQHCEDGVLTKLCGWSSVLTLMYLTEGKDHYKYEKVRYMNSGEASGNKKRVVGYQSVLVEDKECTVESVSQYEKDYLLREANYAIQTSFGIEIEKPDIECDIETGINSAFVSIYVNGELRGCLGRYNVSCSLPELVKDLALAAVFEDKRFKEIDASELDGLSIEISLLTPMKKIHSIEEIVLGKHGVYLKLGHKKGTFLPQVADKTAWNLEQFLGHLARDKAHIGWNGWQKAELYIFEAIIFSS
ncbi:AmmeMemoRadiSam system protein B [Labilibacter marinus]|uniref:AmmeMemoRadiSam system protein B n=1 Tax=Labilibacter marinus TaxID=1477105 RepID=UPI0008303D40|nr:AmmeMemoRadiSam system protein B [Labilibacter marinus]